jgi:hypothetical protein
LTYFCPVILCVPQSKSDMPQDTRSISFGHSVPQMPESSGRSYILTIGIDKYEHLPKLRNAVKDALEVTQLLVSKYQFSETDVTYLLNEQATQKNIFQAFSTLIKIVKPEDIVLLYFSGHGIVQDDINEGYWIPVDGDRGNPGTYIANSSIVNYLRSIKSLHTFVIADSCFSGSMFRGESMRDFTDRQEAIPSRWLMTSGRDTPVSDGKPGENSPFADSILLHLRENQREALPVTSLFRSVSEDVGNNHDQLPRCEPLQGVGHRGGEFALRLKGSVPPPSKIDRDNVQNLDRAGAPAQLSSINWQRIALWALGVVATAAGLLLGYNYLFSTIEPEKAFLAAKTRTIQLGEIPLGKRDTFKFVIGNVGKTIAAVNDIHCSCDYVRMLDAAATQIVAKDSITYYAEWIGRTLGENRCEIVVGGSNVVLPVRIVVQAKVVAAEIPLDTGSNEPPVAGVKPTLPPSNTQKARLVALTPVIDLGDRQTYTDISFAFKLKNTSAIKAIMKPASAACSIITVTNDGGTNIVQPNAIGYYSGEWKVNKPGQQQCTITIGGSNVVEPVKIVLKVNGVERKKQEEQPASTCKVTCQTNRKKGLKITLLYTNNIEYEAVTNSDGDAEFIVPCNRVGKSVKIHVRTADGMTDEFNTTLERFFTIPD